MSVLDTFYLLFKSNSADTIKGNKEIEKTALKAGEATKKTNEESTKLGKAFTNAVEDATRALAAYVSYQGIKSGIIDAQEFNRTLSIQSKLWNANSNEVAGYGASVKAAGGSVQALVGWYDQIYKQNAAVGAPTKPLGKLLDQIHDQVKGLPAEQKQFIFDKYGIGDAGTRSLLSQSDAEYKKSIAAGLELASNTAKGSEAAERFGKSYDNLTTSLQKFWTTIDEYLLPALSGLFDALSKFFSYLANHDGAALAFFTALTAGAIAFTAAIPSLVAGFSTLAAAALGAAVPLALVLGRLTALIAVASAIPSASWDAGQWIGHQANKLLGRGDANGILPGKSGYNGGGSAGSGNGSSMAFWLSQGYSHDQAAGLVANERRESGGNPAARGDGGRASGLFQWHPDRVQNILKGTGIDVRTAGHDDQLRAAAWELQSMGLSDKLKGINDPGTAAAFVSGRYERPANGYNEARIRAASAMQIAGQTPFASQGAGGGSRDTSVHIDKIEVHTQATDANGVASGLGDALHKQIQAVFAQNNDAVAY